MLKTAALVLMLTGAHALAAETTLKQAEIAGVLTDSILYSKDNTQEIEQIFQKSGVTFYSMGSSQSQGNWKIENDQYCSVWPPNQTWACYDLVRDGDKVTFIAKSGKRTEMTLKK
jgi:hypothetical protein